MFIKTLVVPGVQLKGRGANLWIPCPVPQNKAFKKKRHWSTKHFLKNKKKLDVLIIHCNFLFYA